ncbi:hypothetical protein [Pseudomonas turukhanskensis]|nr:hypothetical protein [Pseudomonas turukhanskensis]
MALGLGHYARHLPLKMGIYYSRAIATHSQNLSNCYSGINFYMKGSADRARALLKTIGPKKASEQGGDYERWRNVSKGAVRVSADEIDVLVELFPQHALWLVSGEVAPEIGQTSPDHSQPNEK